MMTLWTVAMLVFFAPCAAVAGYLGGRWYLRRSIERAKRKIDQQVDSPTLAGELLQRTQLAKEHSEQLARRKREGAVSARRKEHDIETSLIRQRRGRQR